MKAALTIILLFITLALCGQTRFYLPSSGTAEVVPAYSLADYNNTAATVLPLVTTKGSTAMTTQVYTVPSSSTNPLRTLLARYVSPPLAAQTISGTVQGVIRTRVSSATGFTSNTLVRVQVIGSNGSLKGTLVPFTSNTSTVSASLHPRFYPVNTTISSYVVSEGDRLVIEIANQRTAGTNSRDLEIRIGDIAATDLSYSEVVSSVDNAPWIQFSQTLQFSTGAPTGPLHFL